MSFKKNYLGAFLFTLLPFAFTKKRTPTPPIKPRILIIHTNPWLGGDGIHVLNLLKELKLREYHADILVSKNSEFKKNLLDKKIKHYTTPFVFKKSKPVKKLSEKIARICKKNNISIVHCNRRCEISALVKAAKKRSLKTILTCHVSYEKLLEEISGLDGVIVIDPKLVEYFKSNNKELNLKLKKIQHIPPIFNAKKFINFQTPSMTRKYFFKQTFGITINDNEPLIVAIGNMYPNIKVKNYPLLLEAIVILHKIYDKNINVVIAGDGPTRSIIEDLIVTMKLEKNVHLLGFTDQTDKLLYYADLFVSASSCESWGIVFLEANLMKKPTIGSWGTGAEYILQHENTGLLFEKDNAQDLASQINRLLTDPELGKKLGINGYHRVIDHFSPEKIFEQIEGFHTAIITNKNE